MDAKQEGRITWEHRVRPKFMAWLSANLSKAEDLVQLYKQMDEAFDIEQAEGQQLDILGQLIGVSRLLDFEPIYAEPLLSDAYYRMLLRAKISLNQWDGTVRGIKDLWSEVFQGYKMEVFDHQDMSMTIRVINLNSMFESEFISRGYLAPKPESVRVNYEFVLTRTLESTLYTGGRVGHTTSGFYLSNPPAVFQMHPGYSFIGGRLGAFSRFTMQDRPPMEGKVFAGRLVCGGALSISNHFQVSGLLERRE